MAIFVYAENINGVYKKAAFEAVSYAKAIADKAGDSVTVLQLTLQMFQMFFTNMEQIK
jgi:electron transfer flavoprotein alpha subunit